MKKKLGFRNKQEKLEFFVYLMKIKTLKKCHWKLCNLICNAGNRIGSSLNFFSYFACWCNKIVSLFCKNVLPKFFLAFFLLKIVFLLFSLPIIVEISEKKLEKYLQSMAMHRKFFCKSKTKKKILQRSVHKCRPMFCMGLQKSNAKNLIM